MWVRGARHTMATSDHHGELVDSLRSAIVVSFAEGKPQVRSVARRLGVSTRTLQRQIGLRGTTFSALVRDVRRDAACRLLLHTEMPVSAIAVTLGFSESSSFCRAFRAWTGATASELRAQRTRRGRAPRLDGGF